MNAMHYTMNWVTKYYDVEKQEWTFPVYNDLLEEIFALRYSLSSLTGETKMDAYKKLATMMTNYDTEVAIAGL